MDHTRSSPRDQRRARARTRVARALAASTLLAGIVAVSTATTPATASEGTGGSYIPVAPSRIADTADDGSGFSSNGQFGGGDTKSVQVTNRAGVPSLASVSAVVVDVAAASSRDTRIYVDSSDETRRLATLTINGADGWDSTTAIVRPGPDGKIKVFNESGATRMNIDVQGYFTKSSSTSSTGGFVPTAPTRVIDSANDKAYTARVQGGAEKSARLVGVDGIPADATGVFAHVRVLNANESGGLRFARGDQWIGWSTPTLVNYEPGRPYDGSGIIPVDSTGHAKLWATDNTSFDIAIDVQGYFTRGTGGGSFHPLNNDRVYDSSSSPSGNLAPGETREIKVGGRVGIPDTADLGAAAISITALDWASSGYVSVVNADLRDDNGTSNLAYTGSYASSGTALTSSAVVEVSSTNTVKIRNRSSSSVRILLNTQGWFDASLARKQQLALRASVSRVMAGAGTQADYASIEAAGIADDVPGGGRPVEVEGFDEDEIATSETTQEENETWPDAGLAAAEADAADDCEVPTPSPECVWVTHDDEDEPAASSESGASSQQYAAAATLSKCSSGHRARRYTTVRQERSALGAVLYRWNHRIHYCTKDGKVTKWRGRLDYLTKSSAAANFQHLTRNSASAVGGKKATSVRQRQIQFCYPQIGCLYHRPGTEMTVTGKGGKSHKKADG